MGGTGILQKYNHNLAKMMESIYPEHDWIPWKFHQVSKGYYDSKMHRQKYVEWLTKQLDIRSLNDWYRVSKWQIQRIAPLSLLRKNGLWMILSEAYPDHRWSFSDFERPKKAAQRMLALLVRKLLPDLEVLEDHSHVELEFRSGNKMQFDVFLPKPNMVLEYQGEQHYQDIYALGPLWQHRERDLEKQLACQSKAITLIKIPYWWDFELESLRATIHKFRPDLVPDPGKGIPIPTIATLQRSVRTSARPVL